MQPLDRKIIDSPIEVSQAAQTESSGQQCHDKPGVLVVDDEHYVRIMVQLCLERHGFEVWLAANGPEAIHLYRMYRDRIAVVLLDVRMPGLDGPRILDALRGLNPAVQACFMSGDPGAYESKELLQHGAAFVIAKPFDLNELARVLRRLTPGVPPTDEKRAAESSSGKETEEVARQF